VQYTDDTGECRIAGSFPHAIHRGMYSSNTGLHGCKDVGNRQVIIVMGMEVKPQSGICLYHLLAEIIGLVRIEDAQCIRKHET